MMQYLGWAERWVREAGKRTAAGQQRLSQLKVEVKGGRERDLVSEVDRGVEMYLRESIGGQFPGHAIVGEEYQAQAGEEFTWVIDPIDGTVNYLRGHAYYSISLALFQEQDCILGLVYAPAMGEMFIAERGKGARCNGAELRVSKVDQLSLSLWGTGMACLRDGLKPDNLTLIPAVVPHLSDFRRAGSAALDLAHVAAGRTEGFWELGLNLYDVAAGVLLVEEAGGTVSDLYGGREHYPRAILASNGRLHQRMLSLFADAGLPDGGWPQPAGHGLT